MQILPGKCIKCQAPIFINGRVSTNYNELTCSLDNGNKVKIGICHECPFDESDFVEALEAGNSVLNNMFVGVKIVSLDSRKNLGQIILDSQGGKCAVSGETIDGQFYITRTENGWAAVKDGVFIKP